MLAALESATSTPANTAALGEEIVELCIHMHAATFRLLTKIREFDDAGGWQQPGLCSCAHWLNFQCGIGMNAAREKLRVAHALRNLPKIGAAFERGEVSFSKVRAMTRVAHEGNEDYLLTIARHGTAHHVERLVQKYRRATRLRDCEVANMQHGRRFLDHFYDADGCLVIKARLPAEQGALIVKALEHVLEHDEDESHSAGQAREHAETAAPDSRVPIAARRADALAEVAETYLASPDATGASADRYQVVVHIGPEDTHSADTTAPGDEAAEPVDCGHSSHAADGSPAAAQGLSIRQWSRRRTSVQDGRRPHIENGPRVTAETSRRLSCDCARIDVLESGDGEPLSIGRKTRTIPTAIRRALQLRDDGCRFPGCTRHRYVDGHHIEHWVDGGETSLHNLVLLCRHHHRLVHEGGFGCERLPDGRIVFSAPDETPLPEHAPVRHIELDPFDWFERELRSDELGTCVPEWRAGEIIDWNLAVAHLFEADAYESAANLAG